MHVHERINGIRTKDDLAAFVKALLGDLKENPSTWENSTLEPFLEAMSSWIEGMDGWYKNMGMDAPLEPKWRTFADILYAAKIYE